MYYLFFYAKKQKTFRAGITTGNFFYIFPMLNLPFIFPYLTGIVLIEALHYKMFKWPSQLYTPLLYIYQLFKVIAPILFCNLFNSRMVYAGSSTPSQMLGNTLAYTIIIDLLHVRLSI